MAHEVKPHIDIILLYVSIVFLYDFCNYLKKN